jgi:hypothetical protein
MKKLTQAEEQIMQVLWSLKSGGYINEKKSKLICLFKIDEPIAKAYCHKVFTEF